jgi:peptide deformylase
MILNLLDDHDPILSQKMAPFDFVSPPVDPFKLAADLAETMLAHDALGIAANQCGLPYRVFIIADKDGGWISCFNPVIISKSETTIQGSEGCLTFPGIYLDIARTSVLEGSFEDYKGQTHQQSFTGMMARAFDHELDHLNGVKFTTYVSKMRLDIARRKARKRR